MGDIKILMVDDEPRMRKLVKDFLTKNGYIVVEAGDGEEAYNIFTSTNDISLIIMDVMMPKMDGYEACKEIRALSKNVPIILLTAKSTEKDELRGFELGVDESILRRSGQDQEDDIIEAGGIVIDRVAHKVTVDGSEIELSFKEFELLEYFLSNIGRALTRDNILNRVWNYDYFGDARTIDTHVKKLRAKLGPKGAYIKTIRAVGYKFEVEE